MCFLSTNSLSFLENASDSFYHAHHLNVRPFASFGQHNLLEFQADLNNHEVNGLIRRTKSKKMSDKDDNSGTEGVGEE